MQQHPARELLPPEEEILYRSLGLAFSMLYWPYILPVIFFFVQKRKESTVRQLEAAIDEEIIAGWVPRPHHHSVFHDLLCIQRDPLASSLLQ